MTLRHLLTNIVNCKTILAARHDFQGPSFYFKKVVRVICSFSSFALAKGLSYFQVFHIFLNDIMISPSKIKSESIDKSRDENAEIRLVSSAKNFSHFTLQHLNLQLCKHCRL